MQALRLKICDSHLTCKVANEFLNVHERVEVAEWNERWSPPFPCCPVSFQCPWKKILIDLRFAIFFQNSFITDHLRTTALWVKLHAATLRQNAQENVKCTGKKQTETFSYKHHVDSTLKQRGNGRFHVVSTWNPRGGFVEFKWKLGFHANWI